MSRVSPPFDSPARNTAHALNCTGTQLTVTAPAGTASTVVHLRASGGGPIGPTLGGLTYEVPVWVVVTLAPGGNSNSEAGGDVENFVISKLVESVATLT